MAAKYLKSISIASEMTLNVSPYFTVYLRAFSSVTSTSDNTSFKSLACQVTAVTCAGTANA